MPASAADVVGGETNPGGFIVRTAVDVVRGFIQGRGPTERGVNIIVNQGANSQAFADFARKNPKAAQAAVDYVNANIPTPTNPNVQRVPRGPNAGQPVFGGILPISLPDILANFPGATATPPIGPNTPAPQEGRPVTTTGGRYIPIKDRPMGQPTRTRYIPRDWPVAADVAGNLSQWIKYGSIAATVIGGVLTPSTITPEVPIPQTAPGPTKRGGARRPIGPMPGSGPIKSGPGAARTPYSGPVGDISPLPVPGNPVTVAPGQLPTPSTPPVAGPGVTAGSITATIQPYLPYILPFISSQLYPRGGTRSNRYTDPLTPSWPAGMLDPLTPFNPGMSPFGQTQVASGPGQDRCNCNEQGKRKKRKKRKPRTVCYTGTYTETATGLNKRKRTKIPCRQSKKRLP